MSKRRDRHMTDEEKAGLASGLSDYWDCLSKEVTGNALFVDATAILDYHDHHEKKREHREKITQFLDKEAATYRYITSNYVVAEVVRKIIHPARDNDFRGVGGVPYATKSLATWIIGEWLRSIKITPICLPEAIFEHGRANLEKNRERHDLTGWTLTDAISYEVVVGLKHNQIVSADTDFRRMGLVLLPY